MLILTMMMSVEDFGDENNQKSEDYSSASNLIHFRYISEVTVPCLRADGVDRCSIALN